MTLRAFPKVRSVSRQPRPFRTPGTHDTAAGRSPAGREAGGAEGRRERGPPPPLNPTPTPAHLARPRHLAPLRASLRGAAGSRTWPPKRHRPAPLLQLPPKYAGVQTRSSSGVPSARSEGRGRGGGSRGESPPHPKVKKPDLRPARPPVPSTSNPEPRRAPAPRPSAPFPGPRTR